MKPAAHPRFSIVVPAYNEAHYIADTIDSLKRQHFKGSYEIIVVDNNSTDQTATIAKSLGAKVVTEKRPGVCYARQAGAEAAEGEIIISTDADTIFARDWLERIDKAFKKNDKIVAVAGPCRFIGGPIWGALYPYFLFGYISAMYQLTKRTWYVTATNLAFKKSAFPGYNTKIAQGGDELDLLRKLRRSGRVVFVNDNPTFTSSRRLARGLIYNVFISFFLYYILEYNLSRLFKRPVLGTAPKFRNELSPKVLSLLHAAFLIGLVILFSLYTRPGYYIVRHSLHFINRTDHAADRAVDKVHSL